MGKCVVMPPFLCVILYSVLLYTSHLVQGTTIVLSYANNRVDGQGF